VLHLHRFVDGEALACFYLLALADGSRAPVAGAERMIKGAQDKPADRTSRRKATTRTDRTAGNV
jgi:hypothetical protein